MLALIYSYRWFIWSAVKRGFQTRYSTSIAGWAWLIIQPLAMILVYTVVFSQIMRSRLSGLETNSFSYSIYLCSGILAWTFFADVINRGQVLFVDNANLIKKLNFPKICLPVILSLSTLLDFLLIFVIFLIFLLLSGNFPGWPFLSFFPILFIQYIFSIGLGISLGVLNVFFPDIRQLMIIVLQLWFWVTPIVYPITTLPEWVRRLLVFNPMAAFIEAYQTIFVHAAWPNFYTLWPNVLYAIACCFLGFSLFRRHSGDLVDEL
jgi:lipopolysaccharide transport system permease protein